MATFENHPGSGGVWEDFLLSRSARLFARSCRTLAKACSEDKTSPSVGVLRQNEHNLAVLVGIATVLLVSGKHWQVIPGVVD